jgi:Kef-type K+ transport system membrane component KefB
VLIVLAGRWRQSRALMADAMPVGLAGGLTAAVLAAAAGWALLATGRLTAEAPALTLAALGVAATVGFVAPMVHRHAAEPDDPVADARLLADAAGQVMLYLMLLGVIAVAAVVNVWLGAALLAFAAGVIWLARLPGESPAWSQGATWLGCAVAGLVGLQIDLAAGFDWLAVLLLWIACGDGRATGALFGARFLANRSWPASWRVALDSYPGGPIALFIAALAAAAGLIDHRLFASLVIAQALTALLARPARRIITNMMPTE